MNQLSNEELLELSRLFQNALQNNFTLFGKHAFRKHIAGQQDKRVLNISLWDVMTVGLAKYSNEQVKLHADELKKNFYELLNDKNFNDSITLGTNSFRIVYYRFKATQKMFEEVLNA